MSFVMIPGAGGNADYYAPARAELARRGHDAIGVDLPAGDNRAGFTEYADVVLDAIGERDDLIVVASSMGAFTAQLVALRRPVRQIVLVNAMVPKPGETAGQWWDATGQREARRAKDVRDGRDPDAPFDVVTYFMHDVPADQLDEVMAGNRPQSDTPFGQPWPLDAWPDVPTRVLIGVDDRIFPVEFQQRLARERLGIEPELIAGGHLAVLTHPIEFVDALLR